MAETIQHVTERARAADLLHPIRLEILRLAREPLSASELSVRLGLSRQRVNYHVRRLARGAFLRRAGRRRRRNMIEQRYVVSALGFVLSPDLLGAVGADWRRVEDTESAGYLLALACQMQSDVIRASRESEKAGKPLSALSLKSQFRFETAAQRERFTQALQEAVVRVVTEHTSPNLLPDGSPSSGRPYRLVLGCYPYAPREAPESALATRASLAEPKRKGSPASEP